ncbi:MAG: hypothetical protein HY983_01305 [Candidatus Magasanikbacteria bacterium]|nr:hypothetical protein [Candidatus Magasanikbacteria bacterium]
MRQALKNYFIPHAGNNFQPHVVHTKRTILYSAFFVGLKAMLFVVALAVPSQVYLHPDILGEQYRAIIELTNNLRLKNHRDTLAVAVKLNQSAETKVVDMARYEYFSHTGPNQRSLAYFLKQAGYQYSAAGENLALGFSDALSVMKAWEKSPTHFENLVDADFKEIGVGLVGGQYQGEPTIYIAQHFGAPAALTFNGGAAPPVVAGKKIADEPWVQIDTQNSHVFWQTAGDATILTVRAKIDGAVASAEARVDVNTIPMVRIGRTNIFAGQIAVPKPLSAFFLPALNLPVVTATDAAGGTVTQTVNWFNVPRFDPSLWTAYARARDFLGPITPIFSVSRNIFAVATIFFTAALALIVAYEFRREHHHLVGQTALMVVLLVGLWWF